MPIVGDFHYNGHLLLAKYPECAAVLAKYRINPGNVGGKRRDENFRTIVGIAVDNAKPVRIGVNWGSLDQDLLTAMMDENARAGSPRDARDVYIEAMLASALRSAELAEEVGLGHDRIIISARSPAYRISSKCTGASPRCDYPAPRTHRGVARRSRREHGGAVDPSRRGIGDTIRVSLTPRPHGDRTEEVFVASRSFGRSDFEARAAGDRVSGCGRTTSTFFQHMAEDIQTYLREQMPVWRERRPGVEELRVAVMGCVVNGPGESKHANIGISLPGTFEEPKAPVYVDGQLFTTLKGDGIVQDFLKILDDYVATRYREPAGV